MNAPMIWIGIPAGLTIALLGVSRWKKLTIGIASLTSLILAGLGWLLPVGKLINIGNLTFEINPIWTILGRRFVLESADRPLVIFLNLALAFWFIGALECDVFTPFVPLAMGINALLIAANLVQPFYYGVILILIAMVLGVGMAATGSHRVGQGMIRLLAFQTLGMPILLLIGWMTSSLEINPTETAQLFSIRLLASVGIGLLLAVFPFHGWLGMIAEESNPFLISFLFFIIPFTTNIFVILFFRQSAWLSGSLWMIAYFRLSGFLMTTIGGLEAAFHRHVGKLMGYTIMVDIGIIQLVISLGFVTAETQAFLAILFPFFFGSMLSLGLLGLSSRILQEDSNQISLDSLAGAGARYPFSSIAIFVAFLSLAGFPLTAGFPAHLPIWQNLFLNFPLGGFSALVGSLGVLIGSVRALSVFMRVKTVVHWLGSETIYQRILLGIGILLLLVLGILPQLYFPFAFNLGLIFMGTR